MSYLAIGGAVVSSAVGGYIQSEGNKSLADNQKNAWLRYAQDGEARTDRQAVRVAETGDRIMDQGLTAYDKSYDQLHGGINEAKSQYAPYSDASAHEKRRAIAGDLGVDAQEAAYGDYRESPGVAWLRERGMSGINRDAAATGSLGGGNRLKALSQFNQGIAEQDFGNYWNRLGEIAGTSYSAAQNLANLGYAGGVAGSDLEERRGAFQTGVTDRTSERFGSYQQQGDQRYLDAIMGTHEAEGQKIAADQSMWRSIGGSALSAWGGAAGGAFGNAVAGYGSSLMPQRPGPQQG